MNLSKEQKQKVQEAIKRIEEKSQGEILAVIQKKSDTYPMAPLRAGLLFSTIAFILVFFYPYAHKREIWYLFAHLGGTLLGLGLCFFPRFKRIFTYNSEMENEVRQRMLEVYFDQGPNPQRPGALIFISEFERQVHILGTPSLNQKVDGGTWRGLIARLTGQLKKNALAEGLNESLEQLGYILEKDFPANSQLKEPEEESKSATAPVPAKESVTSSENETETNQET